MVVDDDLVDILGEDPEPGSRGAAPPALKRPPIEEVFFGVSITWLMHAFRMDRNTVKRRLAQCPPLRMERGNTPLYDLAQAAAYLVDPKVDVAEYIKNMRAEDLPPYMQREFWDAKLKRQQFELRAGDLWRTEDVLNVLGEAFKTLKSTLQLWADSMERATGLTDDQRKFLVGQVDALQDQLYQALVALRERQATRSMISEIDQLEKM